MVDGFWGQSAAGRIDEDRFLLKSQTNNLISSSIEISSVCAFSRVSINLRHILGLSSHAVGP